MIEIRGLHKRFGSHRVLDGVDLTIRDGESIVIIGQSGSGKSVLLKHIIGLLQPDAGRVVVDGQELAALRGPELLAMRRRFGYLFQGAALFDSMTVGENVGLGLSENGGFSREEIQRRVKEKLALVGLRDVEHLKPADLSGGMRKRVGLARALATEPAYILYDEPTTGLDPVMSDSINRLIRELQHRTGTTSIAVTHDMKSAYFIADRLAMLYQGRIVFAGTPQETRNAANPVVQQFIEGSSEGPLAAL
ncbi:MAG TPA: ABC transporter ATP-binding protein [Candidatus Saccharimonadales bacterium]|nr:ABC transporter ATP-binding protein [Candidatus Saccharimonadales bacterium]